jgi:lipid-A-disaccharide synthase-like uncharacterized protein
MPERKAPEADPDDRRATAGRRSERMAVMLATTAFLAPWLGPYLPWLYADSTWWTAVGLTGNLLFSSRFVIQWLYSEKRGRLLVPPIFWHLSFWGSLISLVYALHVDKLPVVLSFLFLPALYLRNLALMRRGGPPETASA